MTVTFPLSDLEFKEVIKNTPLISIDLIIKNNKEEILLGYRKNAPAKDNWFVPGGRIWKNETLDNAFKRITKSELGQEIERKNASFYKVSQHFYDDNKFEITGLSTHYVVISYQIDNFNQVQLTKDDQHSQFRWFKTDELLALPDVHQNTKDYFQE